MTEPKRPAMATRTQTCPTCGNSVTMEPYDIGSGPEMSCPNCEWCWGADGQDLTPLDFKAITEQMQWDAHERRQEKP